MKRRPAIRQPYLIPVRRLLLLSLLASVSASQVQEADHPLIDAVRTGKIEAVKALLASGADPNAKSAEGIAAASAASYSNRPDIVEVLRQAGAVVRHQDPVPVDEFVQRSRLIRSFDPGGEAFAGQFAKFDAVIGRDGSVQKLAFKNGAPELEEPARRAAINWGFEPLVLDGEYVEASTTLRVDFPVVNGLTDRETIDRVARDIAEVKKMDVRKQGMPILEKDVQACDSIRTPSNACADAYDWFGLAQPNDGSPLALRNVEPWFLKALDLRVRSPRSIASMALSLELEGLLLARMFQESRSREMYNRARGLRSISVKGLNLNPLDTSPANPVYRVGGEVSTPSVTFRVDPQYSEEARLMKYSGTVRLSVIIDAEGHVRSVAIGTGLGLGLDEQAATAVQRWVFRPAMKDGHPVNSRASIEVNFRLL